MGFSRFFHKVAAGSVILPGWGPSVPRQEDGEWWGWEGAEEGAQKWANRGLPLVSPPTWPDSLVGHQATDFTRHLPVQLWGLL